MSRNIFSHGGEAARRGQASKNLTQMNAGQKGCTQTLRAVARQLRPSTLVHRRLDHTGPFASIPSDLRSFALNLSCLRRCQINHWFRWLRRALALVPEWAQAHRAELMEDWNLCRQRQPQR